MNKLFFLCLGLIYLNSFSQSRELTTDSKFFFSGVAGLNSTTVKTKIDTFIGSENNVGYLVGVHANYFPDYEYSQLFMRVGIEYSQEDMVSSSPITFQSQEVISSVSLSFMELNVFAAYRFGLEKKFDFYLGGGGFYQLVVSNNKNSYRFEREDGSTFPIFDNESINTPLKYSVSPSNSTVGFLIEFGTFFDIGNKSASIATGYKYSIFLERFIDLNKQNFFLKLGYEIF
ncbi:outer membrane beta-barrel protein [Patiriisocius sp. Uisw_017]|jgi:hypothetical protein|uniref:outer membrane beta-barrel protein n=1 Tax=Patiriisocius sp. Uisw_017 TaxID=3230968 RepID=UPI0039EB9F63